MNRVTNNQIPHRSVSLYTSWLRVQVRLQGLCCLGLPPMLAEWRWFVNGFIP